MPTKLSSYFPLIRSRYDILSEIQGSVTLSTVFKSWTKERQDEFLDICSGARGHRILYDVYFKKIFGPDGSPENLQGLLEAILNIKISSFTVLSTHSALMDDSHSLMVMDILVQLEDGPLVNVEIQRIGYKFPGQRAACYSSDLLLRQYAELKRQDRKTSYDALHPVFTIILVENSTHEFHELPDYRHDFCQTSNTGLVLPLLQEYIFIPLDIFQKAMHDKAMEERTPLEAWLTFLTAESPEEICALIQAFPMYKDLYGRLYQLCRNIEEAMNMFSEQLAILDRNTTRLMIDELRDQVKEKTEEAERQKAETEILKTNYDRQLQEKDAEIQRLKAKLIAASDPTS